MIKYLGSKRLLLPALREEVSRLAQEMGKPSLRVLDLFSGTSRVGHALKQDGHYVVANDMASYAHALARCYVQADGGRVRQAYERLMPELAATPPAPGYFTETFCERSRFVHPKNGARIDAIRERIGELALEPDLEAVALVSLMEAADRVDSTTGVQMAYLKQWAKRAHNDLSLRVPDVVDGSGEAHCGDAAEFAPTVDVDVAYLDPPYNQHSYLGNYHVWESLVRWDKPEVYGIACKRIDTKERRSAFNSKRQIHEALRGVVMGVRCRHLLVSFNNEGYLDREELVEMLSARGPVTVREIDYKRYVGAQIGIYNPKGQKVGKVSHLRNLEYLFCVQVQDSRIG